MVDDRITIGVVRISVEEGSEDRAQLIRHLKALSNAGASELFYDIASRTAPLADRPGLQQAIALVETGIVEQVIIPDVERLTANQTLLEQVIEVVQRHQGVIIPMNLGIDICHSTGKLLASITAAGAEFELSRIRGRLDRSSKFEQSNHLWRGGIRFGLRKRNGKLEPDTQPFLCLLHDPEGTKDGISKAQIALHQIELFEQHRSATQTVSAIHEYYGIARSPAPITKTQLKNRLTPEDVDTFKRRRQWLISVFRWSPSGFVGWLADPVLCGDQVKTKQEIIFEGGKRKQRVLPKSEWEIIENAHTGLISRDRQKEILRIIASNRILSVAKGSGNYSRQNLYKGKVFCAACGHVCHMQSNGSQVKIKKYLYQCTLYIKERGRLKENPQAQLACTQKRMVRIEVIEEAVIEKLMGEAHRLAALAKAHSSESVDEPESLEVVKLRSQISQYKAENDPDLRLVIEAKQAKLNRLLAEQVHSRQSKALNEIVIIKTFRDRDFWDFLEPWERKETTDQLINRIEIMDGKIVNIELS